MLKKIISFQSLSGENSNPNLELTLALAATPGRYVWKAVDEFYTHFLLLYTKQK